MMQINKNKFNLTLGIGPGENVLILVPFLILVSSMTLAFLILSPPDNILSRDVTMHAIHFWGQGRSCLSDQRVTEREGKGEGIVNG